MYDLRIKNMVCSRCVTAVADILRRLGIEPLSVELGTARLAQQPSAEQMEAIGHDMRQVGFELILNDTEAVVDSIKRAVREHAREEFGCPYKLSACLEEKLGIDYGRLSRTFSATEGRTVENYLMVQRVEYVKELIEYGEMTLAEIADVAGFSSAAHLSRLFKQHTGLSPSAYKDVRSRRPLDQI